MEGREALFPPAAAPSLRPPTPTPIKCPLQAQLPPGLSLLGVEEVPVRKLDGSSVEKMGQLLDTVEYYLALQGGSSSDEEGGEEGWLTQEVGGPAGSSLLYLVRAVPQKS